MLRRTRRVGAGRAQIAGILENVELLAGLERPALRTLATHLIVRQLDAGTTVFREGEPGDWMGFLVAGEIHIVKVGDGQNNVTIALESHSRSIGEMALIDGSPRSATCIAAKSSRLLVLTRSDFRKLTEARPAIAFELLMRIARLISRRLRTTSGQLVDHLDS